MEQNENKSEKEKKQIIFSTQNLAKTVDTDFSDAFELSKVGYWKFSFESRSFTFSKNTKIIFELPLDDKPFDLEVITSKISAEDFPKLEKFREKIFISQKSFSSIFHLVMSDGSSRYIEVRALTQFNEKNVPQCVNGTIVDITQSYFRTKKLKESQDLFQSLFEKHSDIFIVFEPIKDNDNNINDYVYKDVNQSYINKFETTKNEIINKKLSSNTELFQLLHTYLKITALTGEAQQNRFYIESIDSFMDILIYSPSEERVAAVCSDVSLIVKTDNSLRESEEKFRQIFNINVDGILIFDFQTGEIIDANPSVCSLTGYQKEELLNLKLNQLSANKTDLLQALTEQSRQQLFIEIQKKDGSVAPSETAVSFFNWNGRKVVQISIRDMYSRMHEQKKLILNEKKYKQLFEFSNDAVFVIKNYRISDYNQKAIDLFGINETELINKTLWNVSPIQQKNGQDSRLLFIENMQQALQGKQLHFEWVFQKKNRTLFYADIKLSPLLFDEKTYIQAIIRDISPKKQIENKLIIKEQRWKHALDTSTIGVWDWNVITHEVYYSSSWKRIIGYDNHEIENTFEEFESRVHPDDKAMVFGHIESYLEAKSKTFSMIFRLRSKSGSYKWINANGRIFSYNNEGKAERFIGTHLDVSRFIQEKTEVEGILSRYKFAAKAVKIGFWDLNLKNMLLTGTPETFSILGFDNTNKLTLKQLESIVHPEDQELFMSQFITHSNETVKSYMFRVIVKNNPLYIHSKSQSVIDNKNQLWGFKGIFQDITHLKQDDLEIKEMQNTILSISEKFEHAVLILQDDEVLFANEQFEKLSGYRFSEYKEKEEPFVDLVVPEDKPVLMKMHDNVAENNISKEEGEVRILTKFNSLKWINVQFSTIKYKARNAIVLIANDITRQKKNELQTQNTAQQMKKFIADAPLAMIIVDENENINYANPGFLSLFKLKCESNQSIKLKKLFSANDYNNIKEALTAIFSENIEKYQTEIITANNVWVNVEISPEKNPTAKPRTCFLYFENIDIARKQIDMLTEENFIYKTTFENSTAGIALFSPKGDLITHNRIFQELLHPQTTQFNLDNLKLNTGNNNLSAEYILMHNQQISFQQQQQNPEKVIFFDISVTNLMNSRGILLIARDITNNFKRDKTLIEDLKRFENLFEQSPVGTALIDKNRSIVICNEKYAQILGYHKQDLIFKKIDMLINSDNLTNIIPKLSELYAGVIHQFSVSTQMVHLEKKIWANMSMSAFTDKYNNTSHAIQTIENITDIKENEENKLVKEQIKTLSKIADSYAHEFGVIFRKIRSNANTLYAKSKNHNSAIIIDEITNALQLNSQLSSFSQKNEKLKTQFDVSELINTILNQYSNNERIRITRSFEPETDPISADPHFVSIALNEIIQNAYESMHPQGGEISVKIDSVYFEDGNTAMQKEISKGKYMRIQVADTGKGISVINQKSIFNPFFTTTSESRKFGMGLTIAQKIIKDQGGSLKIESILNNGTLAYLYIPVNTGQNAAWELKPDEVNIGEGVANLLLIEDEKVVRDVTATLLKNMGYSIFSFENPENAISFYKENHEHIALIIVDSTLPNIKTEQLFNILQSINQKAKVIVLNYWTQKNNNNLKIPHAEYLTKPVSLEKLSVAISDTINKE